MLEMQILDYAHVKKGSRNKQSEEAPFSSLLCLTVPDLPQAPTTPEHFEPGRWAAWGRAV
jgi:hypothetical protein